MMNQCTFIGRLTHDPVTKEFENAKVCNFSLAITRKFKKRDGTPSSQTEFLPFEAWDTGGETIQKFFGKGDWIIVYASAKSRVDKDGVKRISFRVNQFEFPQWPRRKNGNGGDQTESSNEGDDSGGEPAGDEDVPF